MKSTWAYIFWTGATSCACFRLYTYLKFVDSSQWWINNHMITASMSVFGGLAFLLALLILMINYDRKPTIVKKKIKPIAKEKSQQVESKVKTKKPDPPKIRSLKEGEQPSKTKELQKVEKPKTITPEYLSPVQTNQHQPQNINVNVRSKSGCLTCFVWLISIIAFIIIAKLIIAAYFAHTFLNIFGNFFERFL